MGSLRRTKRRKRAAAIAALTWVSLVATLALTSPAAAQTWSPAGNMAIPREGGPTTLLADGRVLVTGSYSPASGNGGYDTKLAELYDPVTNAWSATGSTANGRTDHTATRLLDGRVLVAGGENANICTNDVTSELWDPATGTWSFSGNLSLARTGATATRLNDGRVLMAGGGNRCGSVFASAELYDPSTGTWSPTGSMTTGREWHNAVLLSDGRVLAVGGEGPSPFPTLTSAEIYDPATGAWTPTGSMATTRCCGLPFITRLSDGRVMAAGGYSGAANFTVPNGPQAEIYDPATGVWTPTGSMSVGRSGGAFALLNNGMVLAAGGTDGTTTHSSAELWDPNTGTWSGTAALLGPRNFLGSSVLSDGKVLVVGGEDAARNILSSAEVYSPHVPNPCATITGNGTLRSNNARFDLGARYKQATQTYEGRITYTDQAGGMTFSSTRITSIDNMGDTATITGEGTANGVPVTFEIIVGEISPYFFSIELSNGYSAESSLSKGRIRIANTC